MVKVTAAQAKELDALKVEYDLTAYSWFKHLDSGHTTITDNYPEIAKMSHTDVFYALKEGYQLDARLPLDWGDASTFERLLFSKKSIDEILKHEKFSRFTEEQIRVAIIEGWIVTLKREVDEL